MKLTFHLSNLLFVLQSVYLDEINKNIVLLQKKTEKESLFKRTIF